MSSPANKISWEKSLKDNTNIKIPSQFLNYIEVGNLIA
jgi:hypothetical protein